MSKSIIFSVLLLITGISASAQDNAAAFLEGTWIIDLATSPDAEPYFQEMTVTEVSKTGISGFFYGSPFRNGETNSVWDKTYFAFSTKDGSSTYYSSGYIENGQLKGMTYCDQRNFVMPWTGKRKN